MKKGIRRGNPQIEKQNKIYIGNSIKGAGYKKKKNGNRDCGCGSNIKKLQTRKP